MRILHARAEQTRDLLMQRLRELLAGAAERIIVIVPEQITLQTELDIIDYLALNGSFVIQVLSPARLYSRIFEAAGEPEGVPIDERGRGLLLGAAISDLRADLKWYAGMADRPGFIAKALSQLSELKNAGVTPDDMANLSRESDTPAQSAKFNDIAQIYAAYAHALAGHFADSTDRQRECLKRMEHAPFVHGAHVLMYGFDMITPPLERLALALCRYAAQVDLIIALPERNSRDYSAYESVSLSLNRLVVAARQAGIQVGVECAPTPQVQGDIAFLRHELFAHPAGTWAGEPRHIRLQLLRDPFDEAMEVAAQLRELAVSGFRWREMAVVSPHMDDYAHCLTRACALYGVPLFIAQSRSLAGEPLPRYMLAALRAISHGYRQEDMLDCLKSGFGLPDNDAQLLENYIEQFGITGRKFTTPFKRGGEDLLARVEPLRQAFMTPLTSLKARLETARNMGEQAGALFMLLDEQAALDRLKARQSELLNGAHGADPRSARRALEAAYNAQVWNRIIDLLDQFYLLLGERPADIDLLTMLMRSAMESDEVRALPQSGDAVAAGSIGDIKLGELKALFLIGMQDMPPAADEQLLTDAERSGIEYNLKVSLGLDNRHRQMLKVVDILAALSCARRFVIFSYPMNNSSGAGERPSDVIVRLKRIFPGLHALGILARDSMLPVRMGSAAAAREQIAPLSRRGLSDGTLPQPARKAWRALYDLGDGAVEPIERALTHEVRSAALPRALTRQLYHGLKSVSITRLEQHERCPFAEFVRYGLRPVENLKYEILPRDKGMFYHEAVETFTRRVIAGGGFDKFTPEALLALMDSVTLELERKWSAMIPLGEDSLMRARARDMVRTAKRAAKAMTRHMAGSAFGPAMLEIDFGESGELTLDLPDGPLRVHGRIDRVDLLSDGALNCLRVIDYKLGGKSASLSEMYYGLQLQLLTYLCAALSIKPGYEPAAALYFAVKDPVIDADMLDSAALDRERVNRLRMSGLVVNDLRMIALSAANPAEVVPVRFKRDGELYKADWLVSRDELELLMRHALDMIARIAERIRQGETDILPCVTNGRPVCDYCDYAGICQFSVNLPGARIRTLEHLSADDVLNKLRNEKRPGDGGDNNALD